MRYLFIFLSMYAKLSFANTCLPLSDPCQGATCTTSKDPIGGGSGYTQYVSKSLAKFRIINKDQLLAALKGAISGDVIYVEDYVVIDLSNLGAIQIPAGITLASGRGVAGSKGALIKAGKNTGISSLNNVFKVAKNVRVTGLRFEGPEPSVRIFDPIPLNPRTGIQVQNAGASSNVKIDNNEFFNWEHGAVRIDGSENVWVHHNLFHHNRRNGYGYGVVVYTGSALIENNLFYKNRHDIAGGGLPGSSYEARYNIVERGGNSHSFDMHGGADRGDGTQIAGRWIHIHHNTFFERTVPAVIIRGIPEDGACIQNNIFPQTGSDADSVSSSALVAVRQINAVGNLNRFNNKYGGIFRPGLFISTQANEFYDLLNYNVQSTVELKSIRVADFNGDGKDDLFRIRNGQWQISLSANANWSDWGQSAISLADISFGDFNGDGKADVFYANGIDWMVSYSTGIRFGPWQVISKSSYKTQETKLGDFNGDKCADIFRVSAGSWFVSYGVGASCYRLTREPWIKFGPGSFTLSQIKFGDFNGDGKTDVVVSSSGSWLASYNGNSWSKLATSTYLMSQLSVGDFNGDGKEDFIKSEKGWFFVPTGVGVWKPLLVSGISISEMIIGDFNGDGKSDILVVR